MLGYSTTNGFSRQVSLSRAFNPRSASAGSNERDHKTAIILYNREQRVEEVCRSGPMDFVDDTDAAPSLPNSCPRSRPRYAAARIVGQTL